jgi:hypothetical protein
MSLPDETRGLRLLAEAADAILLGVERELPGWVRRQVERIVEAWGRLDSATRARTEQEAVVAAGAATSRVVADLRRLLAADPADQVATPLQIVRTAFREPTAVLMSAGIPPVERDEFAERAWPDDVYGLVPSTLGDLGDPELGPFQLAWGLAKAGVLRARGAAAFD